MRGYMRLLATAQCAYPLCRTDASGAHSSSGAHSGKRQQGAKVAWLPSPDS